MTEYKISNNTIILSFDGKERTLEFNHPKYQGLELVDRTFSIKELDKHFFLLLTNNNNEIKKTHRINVYVLNKKLDIVFHLDKYIIYKDSILNYGGIAGNLVVIFDNIKTIEGDRTQGYYIINNEELLLFPENVEYQYYNNNKIVCREYFDNDSRLIYV